MNYNPIHLSKLFILTCLIILISTFKVYPFVAVSSDTKPVLSAKKGTHTKNYKPGNFLRIKYKSSEGNYDYISGRLINVTNDSIEIASKKSKPSFYIAISDIISVSKLHKEGRRGWIAMMSVLVLLTVLGIIYINSLLALIFLGIPAVALYTYVPFLFFNFMADILSKKSITKGWQFYIK